MTWQAVEREAHLSHLLRMVNAHGVAVHAYAQDRAARLEADYPDAFAGLRAEVIAACGGVAKPVEGVNVGTPFRIPAGYLRKATKEKRA